MKPIVFRFPYKLWQIHPHPSLPLIFVETTNLEQKCFEIFAIDLLPAYKYEKIFSYNFEEQKALVGITDNFLIIKGFPSVHFPVSKGVFAWNFVKRTYELHESNATWITLNYDKLTYKLGNEVKQLVFNTEAQLHNWIHEKVEVEGKSQIHQIEMREWSFEVIQAINAPYTKYLEVKSKKNEVLYRHEFEYGEIEPFASCMLGIDERWLIVQSSRSSLLLFDLVHKE